MEESNILKVKSGHSKQITNIAVGGGGRQAGHGEPFQGLLLLTTKGIRPKNSECKPLGPDNKYPQHRKKWEWAVRVSSVNIRLTSAHSWSYVHLTDGNSETRI